MDSGLEVMRKRQEWTGRDREGTSEGTFLTPPMSLPMTEKYLYEEFLKLGVDELSVSTAMVLPLRKKAKV